AAPNEMTCVNSRDAKQIRNDVIPWVSVLPASKPAQPPGPLRNATGEDLATRARSFVAAIQSRWSDANSSGLAWLGAVYAQDVDYYGKRLSRDAVLGYRRRLAARWPERSYKISTNSMTAQCGALE